MLSNDASVLGSSGELRVGSARLGELALSLCGVGSLGEVDIGEQRSSWRFSSCEFGALAGSGGAAGSLANVLGCAFAARLALGLQMPGAAATANSAPRRPFRELFSSHDGRRASTIPSSSSGVILRGLRCVLRHGYCRNYTRSNLDLVRH